MSLVTLVFSMVASACLTLAAIYLLIWFRNRTRWANLLFSITAVATAAIAFFEMWMMRSQTPGEFGTAMQWGHVPVWLWVLAIVGFVRFYLQAGRPWLAWTVCAVRTLSLLLNFLMQPNLNYREITSLHSMQFLGEPVSVAQGVINPWMLVGQLSAVLLLIFVVDASFTLWRIGDRRKALAVGGSIASSLLIVSGESVLIWAHAQAPIVLSVPFSALVVAMAHELSRDVLRASQLLDELRESEQRMTLAADAAQLGIWIRDLATDGIWATERWRELFGFTNSERLDFDGYLQRVHPNDRQTLRDVQATAIAEGSHYETEYRLVLPDGQTRWIASYGHVESGAGGRSVLIRGTSRDCTARKAADEEIFRLRQEIAHVGRVSMMGQLASALAHELNQPLGAILRNAEAAELFMQNASPDLNEIRAILADIRADDQRAGAVIDRMHALLRRHELDTRPLDVAELVGDVVALVRTDAAARQVRLDVNVEENLPSVFGDRVHLQQVVLNLIMNGMEALDGTHPGHRRVSVGARREGAGAVEISVRDTGRGIPADQCARIFEPFVSTKPNGMGMGLSISRTIIEAHNGRLWAESDDGGGATFRFAVPIVREEPIV